MLKQRIVSGIILATFTLLAFLVPGRTGQLIFLIFAVSFSTMAIFEFLTLTRSAGLSGFPRLTAAATAVIIAVICFSGMARQPGLALTGLWGAVLFEIFAFIMFLVAGMILVARSEDLGLAFKRFLISTAALALIVGTLGFVPRLYFLTPGARYGRHLLLYLILVTKMADIGAYTIGMLTARRPMGNHKLLPNISPKKSWEGLLGGTAAAVISALFFIGLVPADQLFAKNIALRIGGAIVFGIMCSVFGLLGDLGESILKRATGAKDSGNIPGLGGVLDTLDSMILVTPVFYIFTTIQLYYWQ